MERFPTTVNDQKPKKKKEKKSIKTAFELYEIQ